MSSTDSISHVPVQNPKAADDRPATFISKVKAVAFEIFEYIKLIYQKIFHHFSSAKADMNADQKKSDPAIEKVSSIVLGLNERREKVFAQFQEKCEKTKESNRARWDEAKKYLDAEPKDILRSIKNRDLDYLGSYVSHGYVPLTEGMMKYISGESFTGGIDLGIKMDAAIILGEYHSQKELLKIETFLRLSAIDMTKLNDAQSLQFSADLDTL